MRERHGTPASSAERSKIRLLPIAEYIPLPSVYLPPYDAQNALVVLAPYAGRAYLFFFAHYGEFASFFMSAETRAGGTHRNFTAGRLRAC